MAIDTFNPKMPQPPLHDDSLRSPKRFKQSEEENLAMCLVMLARDSATEPAIPATTTATEPKRINSYKCSVCDKAFPSHQALGGHKASHRVKPPTEAVVQENRVVNYVSALNPRGRIHKCSVCHKIFPTGQALGGHKRKHYEGVIGGAKNGGATRSGGGSSGVTSSTSSSHGESQRYVPDFDLNLPALPELELGL